MGYFATLGGHGTGQVYRGAVSDGPKKNDPTRSRKVKALLKKVEDQLEIKNASLGDYIRLIQLHRELEEEEPKEIKVTWVDPETTDRETNNDARNTK